MAANRCYRGPAERDPVTISDKTVATALLPCTFVTESATAFTAATAYGPMLRILSNRDFYGDPAGQYTTTNPLLTAYASGDTGVAYVMEPGQTYQIAAAAATYTFGQEMVVAAAGRVAGAASAGVVVGFCKTAGAASAGDLIDVEICMPYVKA
jgi:hypothetical protein